MKQSWYTGDATPKISNTQPYSVAGASLNFSATVVHQRASKAAYGSDWRLKGRQQPAHEDRTYAIRWIWLEVVSHAAVFLEGDLNMIMHMSMHKEAKRAVLCDGIPLNLSTQPQGRRKRLWKAILWKQYSWKSGWICALRYVLCNRLRWQELKRFCQEVRGHDACEHVWIYWNLFYRSAGLSIKNTITSAQWLIKIRKLKASRLLGVWPLSSSSILCLGKAHSNVSRMRLAMQACMFMPTGAWYDTTTYFQG